MFLHNSEHLFSRLILIFFDELKIGAAGENDTFFFSDPIFLPDVFIFVQLLQNVAIIKGGIFKFNSRIPGEKLRYPGFCEKSPPIRESK